MFPSISWLTRDWIQSRLATASCRTQGMYFPLKISKQLDTARITSLTHFNGFLNRPIKLIKSWWYPLCTLFVFSSLPPELILRTIKFSTETSSDLITIPAFSSDSTSSNYCTTLLPSSYSVVWNPTCVCPFRIGSLWCSTIKISCKASVVYTSNDPRLIALGTLAAWICTRQTALCPPFLFFSLQ